MRQDRSWGSNGHQMPKAGFPDHRRSHGGLDWARAVLGPPVSLSPKTVSPEQREAVARVVQCAMTAVDEEWAKRQARMWGGDR